MKSNYVVTKDGVFLVKIEYEPKISVPSSDLKELINNRDSRVGFLKDLNCKCIIIGGLSLEDELTPSERMKVMGYIDREYIIYCFNCLKSGNKPITDLDKLNRMKKTMMDNYEDYKDTEVFKLLNYVIDNLK